MEDTENLPFDHERPDAEAMLDLGADDVDDAKSIDCAEVAAWHLLTRALGKAKVTCRPGLYVVVAPGDAWIPALSAIAPRVFRGHPRHGRVRLSTCRPQPEVKVHELPAASPTGDADAIGASVEQEIRDGKIVILVAGTLLAVPPPFRAATDRLVLVPAPDRTCLVAVVKELEPQARGLRLAGLDYAGITPASLRLAYRPETTAAALVRRLRALARKPESRSLRLESLHGVEHARDWAEALATDLVAWRQGRIAWSELPRGLLLAGPPGTGKTTLGAAIANHAGVAFVAGSYAAWQRSGSGYLGDVLKAMARDFDEARKRAPSILFIDELDTLGARGGSGRRDDWWRAVINALLEQMDGTIGNEGLILIGATNHPDLIDPAILRAGRLEDRIDLGPPDANALAHIYADQLTGQLHNGVDLHRIAQASAGLTGAAVVRACKDARRRARREGRAVTDADLLAALGGDAMDADPHEQQRVAVHEAGHALLAAMCAGLSVGDISIISRGDLGGRAALWIAPSAVLTPAVLNDLLAALLGGRAAEEVLFGEISAGAGGGHESDLCRATQLAAAAELSLGMRSEGLIWYPPVSADKLGALFAHRPDVEQAVQRRLDAAYARAKQIIGRNLATVRLLAERLLARNAMTADEVTALVGSAAAGVAPTLPPSAPDGGAAPGVH